ncbi:Nramp family divalent metal transporter [Lachnospiraceae bacterium 54-53]
MNIKMNGNETAAPYTEEKEVEFKRFSLKETISSFGPGIVFALTALGAGDLIDSSVSGSHYGYALMWALVLATLVRFLIVNTIARFDMCNNRGLTILAGYGSMSKFFPYFFMIYATCLGHMFCSIMSKGAGEAIFHIVNVGHPLVWTLLVIISVFMVRGKNIYNKMETVMKCVLGFMTLCFIGLAIATKPNPVEIFKGVFTFEIPDGQGIFGALTLTISLIGAVAGSITNFLYPHSMRSKGWTDPSFKKVQRNDLLFSSFILIVLNLAIWIVGAQILRPAGIQVTSLNDIAQALELAFGRVGGIVFYLGVLSIFYGGILGTANGFTSLIVENVHLIKPERGEKYEHVTEKDPLYKTMVTILLFSALFWSMPGMPDFVVLTLIANMFNTLALPLIAVGLLFLSNKKSLMGKWRNNWFENAVLAGATVLAISGAIKLFSNML